MIRLHGTFDLKDGISGSAYSQAFTAFCAHLQAMDYVASWSFGRRVAHSGYERLAPDGSYYTAIDFSDMAAAQDCYDYVAEDEEPIRSLHRAVNSIVDPASTRFFLTEAFTS
jgi:hypothetical protein